MRRNSAERMRVLTSSLVSANVIKKRPFEVSAETDVPHAAALG
jgi:hypothetical protein